MFDKFMLCATSALACVVFAVVPPAEKGGDPQSPRHDDAVTVQDAQPLPVVPQPAEDLSNDAPVVTPTPEPGSAPVPVSSYCHRINVGRNGGTCVCVGADLFVTCRHLFEDSGTLAVSIDGTSVNARWHLSKTEDVAVVECDVESAACEWNADEPEYLAAAETFGFGSEVTHSGVVSDYGTLSLEKDDAGITQGDSGSGVFVDGVLIGVVRGYTANGSGNKRAVHFTPLHAVPDLVTVLSPLAVSAAEKQGTVTLVIPETWDGKPYNGQCKFCGQLIANDWSDMPFGVVVEQRDGLSSYPQLEWQDARGVTRILVGYYEPWQVKWSWERTQ